MLHIIKGSPLSLICREARPGYRPVVRIPIAKSPIPSRPSLQSRSASGGRTVRQEGLRSAPLAAFVTGRKLANDSGIVDRGNLSPTSQKEKEFELEWPPFKDEINIRSGLDLAFESQLQPSLQVMEQENKFFNISVFNVANNTEFKLEVHSEMTVTDLKRKVCLYQSGVANEGLATHLTYLNKPLDTGTLGKYQIKADTRILQVIRLRGG